MLADPRSRALVDNFAGQWLYLRNLRDHQPGARRVSRTSTTTCAPRCAREVELFFDSVIREDRSVMDLMTAPDTFVNERLARHYGIPNIYGDHFRRVTLAHDERRGLLGKGAILLVTSLATRTSPVVRGKWILENIVGTPPPPPPPNVPALDETRGRAARRRRCASGWRLHRKNAPCSGCHRVMDPIGFALENFDAVGRWRTSDEGAADRRERPLMDGSAVSGPASLRDALARNPEVFVRTMTEKLMTYALGRGLERADMPAVRGVTRSAAAGGYRFSRSCSASSRACRFRCEIEQADQQPRTPRPALRERSREQHVHHEECRCRDGRFCEGAGATLALPCARRDAAGADGRVSARRGAGDAVGFLYVPHGVILDRFTPRTEGATSSSSRS